MKNFLFRWILILTVFSININVYAMFREPKILYEIKEQNSCLIGFDDELAYGIFSENPWNIAFAFSPDEVQFYLNTINQDKNVLGKHLKISFESTKGNINVSMPIFDSDVDENVLTLISVLSEASITSSVIDYSKAPKSDVEYELLKLLAIYDIKSISIEDRVLFKPYPTKEDFRRIFDIGISKIPNWQNIESYRKYRNEISSIDENCNSKKGQHNIPSIEMNCIKTKDLTPEYFVKHPFGFMPRPILTRNEAYGYLADAGWDIYSSDTMLSATSHTSFEIPYVMFGKKVSVMRMFWYKGKNSSFNLEVTDFKTNWTREQASEYAGAIFNNLVSHGFTQVSVDFPSRISFYEKSLMIDGYTIEIYAREGSKYETYDAYTIEIRVFYPE